GWDRPRGNMRSRVICTICSMLVTGMITTGCGYTVDESPANETTEIACTFNVTECATFTNACVDNDVVDTTCATSRTLTRLVSACKPNNDGLTVTQFCNTSVKSGMGVKGSATLVAGDAGIFEVPNSTRCRLAAADKNTILCKL